MLKKPSEPETVEKARPPLHVLHEQLVVVAYVEIVDDGRHAYEIFSEMSHHGYASHVGEAWKAEGRVQAGVAYLESAAGDYHYLWHGGDVDEPPVVYYEVVTVATSYCGTDKPKPATVASRHRTRRSLYLGSHEGDSRQPRSAAAPLYLRLCECRRNGEPPVVEGIVSRGGYHLHAHCSGCHIIVGTVGCCRTLVCLCGHHHHVAAHSVAVGIEVQLNVFVASGELGRVKREAQ